MCFQFHGFFIHQPLIIIYEVQARCLKKKVVWCLLVLLVSELVS